MSVVPSATQTYPYGSRTPGAPVSLVSPEAPDPADRRALRGATATNGTPTSSTPGFNTKSKRWLHGTVKATGGSTVDYRIWLKSEFSEEWTLDTRLGADGLVTVTVADPDNPNEFTLEIVGMERVYIELLNFGGGESVDVWLASSGFVERE